LIRSHQGMVLLMAMKERGSGIVGRKLDFRASLRVDQHHILDDAPNIILRRPLRRSAQRDAETAQLKAVAVQMKRMVVQALVRPART
jgi:hypothetical protein